MEMMGDIMLIIEIRNKFCCFSLLTASSFLEYPQCRYYETEISRWAIKSGLADHKGLLRNKIQDTKT